MSTTASATGVRSSADFVLIGDVISGGGGRSASSNYKLETTVGQSSPVGTATSASFGLISGFTFSAFSSETPPVDTDGDGTPDNVDSDDDNDQMPDDWEIQYGLLPLDDSDATADKDLDGLTNLQEYTLGTNPTNEDSDGDGFTDKEEVDAGTSPTDGNDIPRRGGAWKAILPLILNQ